MLTRLAPSVPNTWRPKKYLSIYRAVYQDAYDYWFDGSDSTVCVFDLRTNGEGRGVAVGSVAARNVTGTVRGKQISK